MQSIGTACLFLAAKVEEQPRKLEHVIKAYHFCVHRDQGPLDVKSEVQCTLSFVTLSIITTGVLWLTPLTSAKQVMV